MNYYIGLLSGTSVDGIDAAIISIDENHLKLVCTHEQHFSKSLKKNLLTIIKTQSVSLKQLSDTDAKLADEFSQAVIKLLEKANLSPSDITAIGSHGQTIFHQPDGSLSNTIQIGSPHRLAASTGITVVSNFRNLDMAYGGQGAPLAPIIHQKLLNKAGVNTAVINLGGITNISFIGDNYKHPIGFDIGPANCLIDEWIWTNQQKDFDKNGNWARKGTVNKILLAQMLNDVYFQQPFPKSTGREYFNLDWVKHFKEEFFTTSANDIQTTLTHLVAASIASVIQQHSIDFIITMGGGAKNTYMQELIEQYCKIPTSTSEKYGYDPDWVEAILFAYLAYKRINKQALDLSSFTGSPKPMLVGDIILN